MSSSDNSQHSSQGGKKAPFESSSDAEEDPHDITKLVAKSTPPVKSDFAKLAIDFGSNQFVKSTAFHSFPYPTEFKYEGENIDPAESFYKDPEDFIKMNNLEAEYLMFQTMLFDVDRFQQQTNFHCTGVVMSHDYLLREQIELEGGPKTEERKEQYENDKGVISMTFTRSLNKFFIMYDNYFRFHRTSEKLNLETDRLKWLPKFDEWTKDDSIYDHDQYVKWLGQDEYHEMLRTKQYEIKLKERELYEAKKKVNEVIQAREEQDRYDRRNGNPRQQWRERDGGSEDENGNDPTWTKKRSNSRRKSGGKSAPQYTSRSQRRKVKE